MSRKFVWKKQQKKAHITRAQIHARPVSFDREFPIRFRGQDVLSIVHYNQNGILDHQSRLRIDLRIL